VASGSRYFRGEHVGCMNEEDYFCNDKMFEEDENYEL
jgi:hypothetical protein